MREFYLKNKPLIILWLMCIMALIVFSGHYANILTDVGREVYYPMRILEGKVLYKDLFNIYGPFSYLWNAVLYKIFGINLFSLYLSGAVCSIGIVSGIYLIAKKFLSIPLSFALGFFTIVTGICANHLFNFTFPYSQAMLYGTISFIYSVYFIIRFKETELSKYLYLSGVLAGLAVANKYEFVIYAGFLFIVSLFTKNRVYILNFIISVLAIPLISFAILFLQGLRVDDLIMAAQEIRKMTGTQTLKYFYASQGVFFTPKAFAVWGINLLKTGIPFALILWSCNYADKNRILYFILTVGFAVTAYSLSSPAVFVFLIPLLVLSAVFGYRKLKTNVPLLLLVISAITVSVKSFWGLIPLNYGNYYIAIVLTAFLAIFFTFIDEKYQKNAAIFLIAISFSFLNLYIYERTLTTGKIASPQGKIYTYPEDAAAVSEVLSFLNNDYGDAKAVIYPEGLMINFLSQNSLKADDYYNSMIPLYVESMGEEKFINNLKKTKPEFVIFTNQSTADYYFKNICTDYAQQFCMTVVKNYEHVKQIDGGAGYLLYKKTYITYK